MRAARPVGPRPSPSRPRGASGTTPRANRRGGRDQAGAPNMIARRGAALKVGFTGRTRSDSDFAGSDTDFISLESLFELSRVEE